MRAENDTGLPFQKEYVTALSLNEASMGREFGCACRHGRKARWPPVLLFTKASGSIPP